MTEGVARLFEEVAGTIGIALGPEVRHQFVAAHALAAGGGQEGEEGEGLALHGRAGERHAVFLDRKPAERPQFQHDRPSDRFLTRLLRRRSKLALRDPRGELRHG